MKTDARRWQMAAGALAPVALVLCGGSAAAAPAGAPVVQVVELWEPSLDQRAQALTNALREVIFDANEFALNTDNPQLLPLAQEAKCEVRAFDAALGPTSDRGMTKACVARMAKRRGAKGGLFWGYLYTGEGGRTMVKAHLWQQGEDRVVTLAYEGRDRRRLAERLYQHLVFAGGVGDARFAIEGAAAKGELFVNGRAQGAIDGAAELTLPVGEVAAEVRAGGKVVAFGRGLVVATGVATVRLEPVVEPVALPTRADPGAGVRAPLPPPAGPPGPWQRPVGWAVVATGAALLGVGAFATARASGLEGDFASDPGLAAYKADVARGGEVCDAAEGGAASRSPGAAGPSRVRDRCSSLSRMHALQGVGFVGGGLLAAGGAVLLLTAPSVAPPPASAAKARWRFVPSVGPAQAAGALHVTW